MKEHPHPFTSIQSTPAIIRRLRLRFVRVAMRSLLLILILLIGVINLLNLRHVDRNAMQQLDILCEHEGEYPTEEELQRSNELPRQPQGRWFEVALRRNQEAEMPYQIRYFSIRFNANGALMQVNVERVAAVTGDEACAMARRAYRKGRDVGYTSGYKYKAVRENDGSTLFVFLDISTSLSSGLQLLMTSIFISIVALVLMLLFVWLLSGQAIAPVVESMEKQKQFISDAGHELKTPVTIISANLSVLEMTAGTNEWTDSIHNQLHRMTRLINSLLTLTRMNEFRTENSFTDVDFSVIVAEAAHDYIVVKRTGSRNYTTMVPAGIHVFGDARSLEQLCSALLDNAMKYSPEHGNVSLVLSTDGRKVRLQISNTCTKMPEGDLNRLFDRFYRADTSRNSQTGGSGIGLSVARAVCENHGGEISVEKLDDTTISFTASLPALRSRKNH